MIYHLQFFVKELTKTIHGSYRNVTMDNWFTSVSLADELLENPYKLTILGTLRKNKKEIPAELLQTKERRPATSMFCFDKQKTLLSYAPKKGKVVLLLSTLHEGAEVCIQTGKPCIVLNYNETKAGVDTFDQLCSSMSCSRKTRRWPLCIFYGILNAAGINSYVVYCHNKMKANTKPLSRCNYIIDLAHLLAKSWMEKRLKIPNLRKDIRQYIRNILKIPDNPERTAPQEKKRKVCYYCPSRIRRMTTTYCNKCGNAICGEHRGNYCTVCTI